MDPVTFDWVPCSTEGADDGTDDQSCPSDGWMLASNGWEWIECRNTNGQCEMLDYATWNWVACNAEGNETDDNSCPSDGWMIDAHGWYVECRTTNGQCEMYDSFLFEWVGC